jgi:hypothetical protein
MKPLDNRFVSRLLTRRSVLKNAALMTLLAPVLRRMEASAATPASARRLILLFSPNGPMRATGPASGTETAFSLHDWWMPLQRHSADAIFLSHMACTGAGVVTGNGHGLGGQTYSGFGAGTGGDQYAQKGPTIDQVIGKRLQAEQRAGVTPSVVWGNFKASEAGGTGDAFCTAAGRNISPETDPSSAWAQLFASFMPPAQNADAAKRAASLVARNHSVLDFVVQDCMALQGALGAEGTRLLDDHCTTVRDMERTLVSSLNTTAASACTKPANPGPKAWTNPENIDVQSSTFIDLMATTLACELTNVIAFQFGGQAARNHLATKYGVPSSPTADSGDSGPAHHPWTHQGNSDTKTTAMRIFTTFYATQVALLIDKLKSTVDANGKPLLDSTMVLWASELGGNEQNADPHQTSSVPAVLMGNGQGTFKTGRYLHGKSPDIASDGSSYQEAGRDMARLLVSLAQYMGLSDVTTVGATGVNGPLTSLYA